MDKPTYVLCGPQAIGKTRNSADFAALLGCDRIVDDWDGVEDLLGGTLAITNAEYTMPAGAVAFHVEDEKGLTSLLATLTN